MKYGSVCSGIEAATVAWHPLGWTSAFFSEIEKFPRAVLAHHFPDIPCHGDFTTIEDGDYEPIDLLVGGTPCQDFSVAGQRAGLDGERGNLTLEYARLARRLRPRWMVWENVPGAFTLNDGRDFGAVLACFAGYPDGHIFAPPRGGGQNSGVVPPAQPDCYGLAWRVLDAQFAGVPQQRRRIFVVGYLGDWRRAAAVLFERQSLSGDSAPRREARSSVGALTSCGVGTCGADDNQGQAGHLIPVGIDGAPDTGHALTASQTATGRLDPSTQTYAIHSLRGAAVRRLTPRECERLQGFPDNYTLVPYRNKPASDGPRYKALGNSMAVPVMAWIGKRIQMLEGA